MNTRTRSNAYKSGLLELQFSDVAHHDLTLAFPSFMIMSLAFRVVAFAWGAEMMGVGAYSILSFTSASSNWEESICVCITTYCILFTAVIQHDRLLARLTRQSVSPCLIFGLLRLRLHLRFSPADPGSRRSLTRRYIFSFCQDGPMELRFESSDKTWPAMAAKFVPEAFLAAHTSCHELYRTQHGTTI